ncbi:hypothetical protein GR157_36090 [Burkholderia sp. 4701]|nr:hypothetical protein [Burkholderia sp. 4701]MXN86722.1 hypothetical protein [Burkholderia sp. 4812]
METGIEPYNYDVNGNRKSVYDDGGGQQGSARAFSYWTDLRGQVQRRYELVGVSIAPDGTITGSQGDPKHNLPYLQQEAWNGSYFGSVPPGAHNLAPMPPRTTFPGYQIPPSLLDW